MGESVVSPAHYGGNGVECIEAIRAMLTPAEFAAHCRATALKYLWRAGRKGPTIPDLEKAAEYIKFAITEARR